MNTKAQRLSIHQLSQGSTTSCQARADAAATDEYTLDDNTVHSLLQDALTDASARMREVHLPQLLGQDTPSFIHRVETLISYRMTVMLYTP